GVDLEVIDAGDAGRAVGTLLAGKADFASGAFEHVIKAREENKDLVMTALYVKYPAMSLVVGSDSADEITSVEDLRGKRVGTSSPGSAAHYNLISLLKSHDMSESDVELVFAGLSEMPAALKNGQVEAGMVVDPFTTQTISDGTGSMLFDLGTEEGSQELYGSEYAMSGLMTQAKTVEENPELAQKVTTAVVRALEYIHTHTPEEVAEAMPDDYSSDKETLTAAVEHMKDAFTENGMMPAEAADTTATVLADNGVVSEKAIEDVPSLYDMQFVESVEK
ncbi:MAG: ABC transporter substrate-binding protein, partial [Nocardioidaceae bacterium]